MRITIVTPSFKQLDWLRLCVASVADQAGGDVAVEHIIQDAGTPGIEEFARERRADFYRGGERVFSFQRPVEGHLRKGYSLAIYSEKDDGMYDAINKGLRRAQGGICAYLNCDEQYLPGTLRWVADFFHSAPKVDMFFGAAIVVRGDGSYVCDRRVMVPTRWHTMLSGNLSIFTSSTFFLRKSVVDPGFLFDPQWRVCGDAVWIVKLLDARLEMHATKQALSAFTETGNNLSGLSGNSQAAKEHERMARLVPAWLRWFRPLIVTNYRIRRLLHGAYTISPHRYEIFTRESPECRKAFVVNQSTFRWSGPG